MSKKRKHKEILVLGGWGCRKFLLASFSFVRYKTKFLVFTCGWVGGVPKLRFLSLKCFFMNFPLLTMRIIMVMMII